MKMPPAIEYSVRKQNIKFMHNRNQFSAEYFQFIRKLVSCNPHTVNRLTMNERLVSFSSRIYLLEPKSSIYKHHLFLQSPEAEELAMLSVQLASRFLFYTGFHTKKTLRGAATDWYDILCHHLRGSKAVRSWFAHNVLFNHPHRFCEYLLSCPSTEVRTAFLKILVFLAHFSLQDGPCVPPSLNAPSKLYVFFTNLIVVFILSFLFKRYCWILRQLSATTCYTQFCLYCTARFPITVVICRIISPCFTCTLLSVLPKRPNFLS